jgi:hypothetical protein
MCVSELTNPNRFPLRSIVLVVLAALITSLGLYLRIRNLDSESVEGDELFSRRVALSTPSAALDLTKEDLVHPPLYYFALKGILPVSGANANGIRFFSLACGVASIAVLLVWGFVVPTLQWSAFFRQDYSLVTAPTSSTASRLVRTRFMVS